MLAASAMWFDGDYAYSGAFIYFYTLQVFWICGMRIYVSLSEF